MSTLFLALLAACAATPQDHAPLVSGRPAPAEQTCYDVLRYDLDVEVLPEERAIRGTVLVTARMTAPTQAVVLDLDPRLVVAEVVRLVPFGDDFVRQALPFTQADGELRVPLDVGSMDALLFVGDVLRLEVRYAGRPRVAPNPPWDGGFQWSQTPSGAPWIATSNQMQGADLWWPCKDQPDDEPDSAGIRVTVPSGLVCASNGKLVAIAEHDGKNTFTWEVSTPINAYGIALNIAPYEALSREYTSTAGDTFPVTYWVLPEHLEQGRVLFEDLLRQLRWFEETYGPYPFRADKCGLVETPHLGMEHQTIIAYGNEYHGNPWGEDQGFDFLLHHEMSHEWWANLVTCRNWKDFWIHEGFATYAQALYTEHLNGPEAYRLRMAELRMGLLNRGPVAPREPMSSPDIYFGATGADIYNKGAWVLHTLRYLLGDEVFFRTQRRIAYPDPALEATTDGSACRFTDTDEVLAICERESGRELDWFFEVYLRRPWLPRLVSELDGDTLRLAWMCPEPLDFPMPVEVEVDGETHRVAMDGGEGALDVTDAVFIEIDPRGWLLMSEQR
ncbi:MAG: M1 family metallopeptidase [Planctomycetes bacterium]|nr:M1 family metallopeptidase [Planctomycetota bacterium]